MRGPNIEGGLFELLLSGEEAKEMYYGNSKPFSLGLWHTV